MASFNIKTMHIVDTTPPTWTNSFAVLDIGHGVELPVLQLTRTMPRGLIGTPLSLKDIVTSSFQKIFDDTMDNTPQRHI
jgi:hypothetical protein